MLTAACLAHFAINRGRPVEAREPGQTGRSTSPTLDKKALFAMRRRVTSAAQSVSYANTDPLLIVSAHEQYLVDETGNEYLDTRNNVCHVGHCHPAVVKAVSEQVAKVNTNTRYLHPKHVELARRLLATVPGELASGAVFFVNSGSEANDLALRLARTHTGARHTLVVERAYHGHTAEVMGISPYKYSHPTIGKPDWVTEVHAPDTYRGLHRGADAAEKYAAEVERACHEVGDGNVAAFFIESGMSVAGVIVPPAGYLQQAFAAVRKVGGVCVADEVQTGFGRCGTNWWAFEQHGVVPDIVTCGKPFGNGMPLAAVICRQEIAERFATGPEYFNTFGGNPVCCAAGLAVLDVVVKEGLMEHANTTGQYLRDRVEALGATAAGNLIGKVRGTGLFIGIEFVRDRNTLEPATAETSWICSQLKRQHRILTSIDGPCDNVVVIKPPMVFSTKDVDTLVDAMALELERITTVDLAGVTHTPT